MEIRVSRQEMRRRLFARMGTSTDGLVLAESEDQANELLRAAALHIESMYEWPVARTEDVTLSLGVDQRFVTRPTGCAVGSVVEFAVWDADEQRYFPLRRGRIDVRYDNDPTAAAGGDDAEDDRGRPRIYEELEQIEVWPRPDKVYETKLIFNLQTSLDNENDLPLVDSELIILWALADYYENMGEDRLAQSQRQKFQVRYGAIRNTVHAREILKMGSSHRNAYEGRRLRPNYDTRPSTID